MSSRMLSIVSFGFGLLAREITAAPAPATTTARTKTAPALIKAAADSGTTNGRSKTAANTRRRRAKMTSETLIAKSPIPMPAALSFAAISAFNSSISATLDCS